MVQDTPSRKLDQYIVRFPDGMRDKLKKAAKENNRSLNAEIIARLEEYPRISLLENSIKALENAVKANDHSEGLLKSQADKLRKELKQTKEDAEALKTALVLKQSELDALKNNIEFFYKDKIEFLSENIKEISSQRDRLFKSLNVYATNYKISIQLLLSIMQHLDIFLERLIRDYKEKSKLDIESVTRIRSLLEESKKNIKKRSEEFEHLGRPEDI